MPRHPSPSRILVAYIGRLGSGDWKFVETAAKGFRTVPPALAVARVCDALGCSRAELAVSCKVTEADIAGWSLGQPINDRAGWLLEEQLSSQAAVDDQAEGLIPSRSWITYARREHPGSKLLAARTVDGVTYLALASAGGETEAFMVFPDGREVPAGAGPFAAECGRDFLEFITPPAIEDAMFRGWWFAVEAMEDFGPLLRGILLSYPRGSSIRIAPVDDDLLFRAVHLNIVQRAGGLEFSRQGETIPLGEMAKMLAAGYSLAVFRHGGDRPAFAASFEPKAYCPREPSAEVLSQVQQTERQQREAHGKQVLFKMGNTGLFAFACENPGVGPRDDSLVGLSGPMPAGAEEASFEAPVAEFNDVTGPVFTVPNPRLRIRATRVASKLAKEMSLGFGDGLKEGVAVQYDARQALLYDPSLPLPGHGLWFTAGSADRRQHPVVDALRGMPNIYGACKYLGGVFVLCQQVDPPASIRGCVWCQYSPGLWALTYLRKNPLPDAPWIEVDPACAHQELGVLFETAYLGPGGQFIVHGFKVADPKKAARVAPVLSLVPPGTLIMLSSDAALSTSRLSVSMSDPVADCCAWGRARPAMLCGKRLVWGKAFLPGDDDAAALIKLTLPSLKPSSNRPIEVSYAPSVAGIPHGEGDRHSFIVVPGSAAPEGLGLASDPRAKGEPFAVYFSATGSFSAELWARVDSC